MCSEREAISFYDGKMQWSMASRENGMVNGQRENDMINGQQGKCKGQ